MTLPGHKPLFFLLLAIGVICLLLEWSNVPVMFTAPLLSQVQVHNSTENGAFAAPPWIPVDYRRLILKSAYLDLSERPWRLQILANLACRERRHVRCVFHSMFAKYDDPAHMMIADVEFLNSEHDSERCSKPNWYEPHLLQCWMPRISEGLALFRPTFVSVIPDHSDTRSLDLWNSRTSSAIPRLPISYSSDYRYELSVCVPPLYNWTDTHSLVLFIEYYIGQGANQFLVYNYSSSHITEVVLRHYVQVGLVRVVQWPQMPSVSDGNDPNPRSYYRGQILMMNDCLWQLRGKTEFAAMVDLDEFIVPLESETQTILEFLRKYNRVDIGSFSFTHSYAWTYFPWHDNRGHLDLNDLDSWLSLLSMSKAHVTRDPAAYKYRSKVIVKPKAVRRQTVHRVWSFKPGFSPYEVSRSMALLYHFRRKNVDEFGGNSDSMMMNRLSEMFG